MALTKWYCLNVGDSNEAKQKIELIKKLLWPILARSPEELIGIFDDYKTFNKITTVFFTPASRELAEILQAEECEKPSSGSTTFIAGNGHCPYEFFPEKVRIPIDRKEHE